MFSHIVRMYRSQKFWGPWEHSHLGMGGVSDLVETWYSPTCFIIPNFVTLDQIVWA